jgi:hypothetical protein
MTVHYVWCLGCGAVWADPDCVCTCSDDSDPLYELWVVDPELYWPSGRSVAL